MSVFATTEVVRTEAATRIVRVAFYGDYPDGAAGDVAAERMSVAVVSAVRYEGARAVIFDLSGLRYRRGDAIASIVLPLLDRSGEGCLPACVVAKGETATAIGPLMAGTPFEVAGARLLDDVASAAADLETRLGAE